MAHWLADRIISLPIYAEMTSEQRAAVIEGVRSFYKGMGA
jgi:dTDP-4-amino-4,6-dideoxygalactose transaminase